MAQLKLFEENEEKPRQTMHYDKEASLYLFKHYESENKKQQEQLQTKPRQHTNDKLSNLEKTTIDEWTDMHNEYQTSRNKFLDIKKYQQSTPEQKKEYLQRNHPKFRGESHKAPQNISHYTNNKIFGLFSSLVKSYETTYKKREEALKEFREQHKDTLTKYNL